MRFLLDTYAFIWWDTASTNLPPRVLQLFSHPAHTLLLSVASIWEMQIKIQLGKLRLSKPLPDVISEQRSKNRIDIQSVNVEHIYRLDSLPNHHRDPFDRLLIAQAVYENIALVSNDPLIAQYPVQLFW